MIPRLSYRLRPKTNRISHGVVKRIRVKDLPVLAERLSACKSDDPYLVSAAYYGFTGRNGLWVYEEGDDFIPFCIHPNVPGKILVFPSVSAEGLALAGRLFEGYFSPGGTMQLARMTPEDAEEAVTRLSWTTKGYRYDVMEEPVLDWLFPVHTLSTDLVMVHQGGAFNVFRGYLNRIDMSRVRVETMDIRKHYGDMMALTMRWANERSSDVYSYDDLFGPTAYIIRMVRDSALDMCGSVIYVDGVCASFSIWEMPSDKTRPASSVATLSHAPVKGLSELQQLERCRILQQAGVARVCIGGSETPGLDAYKRKLSPVESLSLKSVSIRADEAFLSAMSFA